MSHPMVAVAAAVLAVAVVGRAAVAVVDRRWAEVLCEAAAVALLVLVMTGRVPSAVPGGPDPAFHGGDGGVQW